MTKATSFSLPTGSGMPTCFCLLCRVLKCPRLVASGLSAHVCIVYVNCRHAASLLHSLGVMVGLLVLLGGHLRLTGHSPDLLRDPRGSHPVSLVLCTQVCTIIGHFPDTPSLIPSDPIDTV